MNLKKITKIILLFLVVFSVISGFFIGLFYGKDKILPIFISFHLIGILYLVGFFLLFFTAKEIIWITLSTKIKNSLKKKEPYDIKIFGGTFLFFLGILFLNHYIYNYKFSFWMVGGNISLLCFFLILYL